MSSITLRKNDFGTVFHMTVTDGGSPVDISGASDTAFCFRRPDQTNVEKTATVVQDGAIYKMEYVVEDGFFNQAGTWHVQAHLTMNEFTGTSQSVAFVVEPSYCV